MIPVSSSPVTGTTAWRITKSCLIRSGVIYLSHAAVSTYKLRFLAAHHPPGESACDLTEWTGTVLLLLRGELLLRL